MLSNGGMYTTNSGDLEKITRLIPGVYNVQDTHQGCRSYDLEVQENVLKDNVLTATIVLSNVIRKANMIAATAQNKHTTAIKRAPSVRNTQPDLSLRNEVRGPG